MSDRTRKRKEQRWRKSRRESILFRLERRPDVMDTLAGIDHPKLTADEHSMLSYVYWLINHNYIAKAEEIIDAHSCSN